MQLFCQDESWLDLPLPHRLTDFRVKLCQVVYKYYWLHGTVELKTGKAFFLEKPRLDTEYFGVILAELARPYPESLNMFVLDQAPDRPI